MHLLFFKKVVMKQTMLAKSVVRRLRALRRGITREGYGMQCVPLVAGLTSRLFMGFSDIYEVTCDSDALPPELDTFSIVLFRVGSDKVLGHANLKKRECSTADSFVSCTVAEGDTKNNDIRILISDLADGESLVFGCNLTAMTSGGIIRYFTWTHRLTHSSKMTLVRVPASLLVVL